MIPMSKSIDSKIKMQEQILIYYYTILFILEFKYKNISLKCMQFKCLYPEEKKKKIYIYIYFDHKLCFFNRHATKEQQLTLLNVVALTLGIRIHFQNQNECIKQHTGLSGFH